VNFSLLATVLLSQRTTVTSCLGLVSGIWGIVYGLNAKQFTAYGHLSSENAPRLVET
jgi:hypothetical protein